MMIHGRSSYCVEYGRKPVAGDLFPFGVVLQPNHDVDPLLCFQGILSLGGLAQGADRGRQYSGNKQRGKRSTMNHCERRHCARKERNSRAVDTSGTDSLACAGAEVLEKSEVGRGGP